MFQGGQYLIVVANSADTTVAMSDNAYGRIVMTSSAVPNHSGLWGVYRFDQAVDLESLGIEPKKVSAHYPVRVEFFVAGDED